jgi:hypothetical protein
MIFSKNGYTCILARDTNEPYDLYCKRGWFVVSQLPSSDNIGVIVKYSRLWINKQKGCQYSSAIMNKLVDMEEKLTK